MKKTFLIIFCISIAVNGLLSFENDNLSKQLQEVKREKKEMLKFEWEGLKKDLPTEPGAKIQISGINQNVFYLNAVDE
jgi:hypothetical protein